MAMRPAELASSPWPGEEALAMGEKAVKGALSRGADAAEAYLCWSFGSSVDIEGGRTSYPTMASASGISLRVLKGGRMGFAYCTHEDMLGHAADMALALSKISKARRFHFPDRAAYHRPRGLYDPSIVALAPEKALEFALEMISAAKERAPGIMVSGGGLDFGCSEVAIVNSNGMEVSDRGTMMSAGAYVTLKGRTVSTGFDHATMRRMGVDFAAIGRNAAQLALDGRGPVPTATGRRTVLFTPEAATAMLGSVTVPALYGDSVGRGESVYAGKVGQIVAAPLLTLSDDGLLPGGLGTSASDDEGVPSRATVLIEKGVLKGFLYDVRSAADAQGDSTGNGVRFSYRGPPDIGVRNILVKGHMRPLEELISETEDGLLVHEVLGAHTASSVSGDFSVNCPLLFQIHKGERGRPLKPVMLSGNLPQLLPNITGLGKDQKQLPGDGGAIVTGSVRIENVMVTG